MLGFISIIVLILLGALNARAFVSGKHPRLRDFIDRTSPFENYIGLLGIILALFIILTQLTYFHGLVGIIGLASGLVMLALALLSSSRFLKEQVFRDNASMQTKLDSLTAKLGTYQQNLGLAGIALGIVYLLMMLGAY